MTVDVKIVNSIRGRALQYHQFKSLRYNLDATYGELFLHADLRHLNGGKVLQRIFFLDLIPEIVTFLRSINEMYNELSDHVWLLDLGFLADVTANLNKLNRERHGEG